MMEKMFFEDIDNPKKEIAPLLLIPFVENAFKYGTGIEQGEIEMSFDLKDSNLFSFQIKNKFKILLNYELEILDFNKEYN